MRWIKASERLPNKSGWLYVKANGIYMEIATYDERRGFQYAPPIKDKPLPWELKDIEWLDQSGEGDAVDGWISLKDRLPKHGQKVDLWLGSYRKEWTWEGQDSENIMISGAKATHWMPAPTPPKPPIK